MSAHAQCSVTVCVEVSVAAVLALVLRPVQVFAVHMVGRAPVTRWLGRLVRARFLRIIAVEFRPTFHLRVEILGCKGGESRGTPPTPDAAASPFRIYRLVLLSC